MCSTSLNQIVIEFVKWCSLSLEQFQTVLLCFQPDHQVQFRNPGAIPFQPLNITMNVCRGLCLSLCLFCIRPIVPLFITKNTRPNCFYWRNKHNISGLIQWVVVCTFKVCSLTVNTKKKGGWKKKKPLSGCQSAAGGSSRSVCEPVAVTFICLVLVFRHESEDRKKL